MAKLSINGMVGYDMERLKLDSYLTTFLKTVPQGLKREESIVTLFLFLKKCLTM